MIALVMILACGFVREVSALQVPSGSDATFHVQAGQGIGNRPLDPSGTTWGRGAAAGSSPSAPAPRGAASCWSAATWAGSIAPPTAAQATPSPTPACRTTTSSASSPIPWIPTSIYLGCQSGVHKSTDRGQDLAVAAQRIPPEEPVGLVGPHRRAGHRSREPGGALRRYRQAPAAAVRQGCRVQDPGRRRPLETGQHAGQPVRRCPRDGSGD